MEQIPLVKEHLTNRTDENLFKSSENNGAIFDVDNIMEVIDSLDRTNYSFHFKFVDTPEGTFYNLVVGRTPEGELKAPYVLRYVCSEENLEEFVASNNHLSSFKGKMFIHKYSDYFASNGIFKSTPCETEYDHNGDPIPCYSSNVNGEDESNNGGADNTKCTSVLYVKNCGAQSSNIWHRATECGDPTKEGVIFTTFWQCSTPTKSGFIKNSADCGNCTEGSSSDGHVGVNTEDEDSVLLKSDCKNLNELSLSKSFNSRINELMQNNSGNTEVGYWGRTNSEGKMIFDSNDRFEGDPNQMEIETPLPSTPIDSYIHNHFNNGQGTLPVFSGSDLVTVYNLYTNGSISNLRDFLMLVTTPGDNVSVSSDDTVYAITISNVQEFISFGDTYFKGKTNEEQIGVIDNIYALNNINSNISSSLNEKRLATLLESNNFGMSLYRGDTNDLTKWTRLKFKNGAVKEDTCP